METKRLFLENAYLSTFEATVLACAARGDGDYDILLDKTAFFPEGGGQAGDRGRIGDTPVFDTHEKDGQVLHRTHAPLEIGQTLACEVDFATRFDRMQNHTAEHIVSGIAHRLFGVSNVGFHLNDAFVTLDFDRPLDREALDRIEDEANAAVFQNLPVSLLYPTKEELAVLDYRSKKELSGQVRLVSIAGVDLCACCAPHVKSTGEIGLIKLLDCIHYKGGVRIRLLAGRRALLDYREKYHTVAAISAALSVPQADASAGVDRTLADLGDRKLKMAELARALSSARAETLSPNAAGNILAFYPDTDDLSLRNTALAALSRGATVAAILSGEDGAYRIAITAACGLRALLPTLRERLCLRGGGSDELLQGRALAKRAEIEAFFEQKLL